PAGITLDRAAYMRFVCRRTASRVLYALSLHDALPISDRLPPSLPVLRHRLCLPWRRVVGLRHGPGRGRPTRGTPCVRHRRRAAGDRKSTRLNSSHVKISYAVFCLKKERTSRTHTTTTG